MEGKAGRRKETEENKTFNCPVGWKIEFGSAMQKADGAKIQKRRHTNTALHKHNRDTTEHTGDMMQ